MGELDDPAAFRALFEAHFADLHRYLAHRLGDPGAAEDLAAETFLSVLPHEPRALAAFLHRAARRQRPGGPESNIGNTFGTDVTTFLRRSTCRTT